MLEVRDLNVWYGPTEVVRNGTFTVPTGAIVALLGGNGSGKTTILNTLTGLVTPRAGSVRLAGAEVAGLPTHQIVRSGMVQVPQGREVFAGMTVADNLAMGATTRRGSAAIRATTAGVLEMFPALRQKLMLRAGALSGGEQQQVAIARALMADPRVLLMDEPSAGLSPLIAERMAETILMLNGRGLTILLVEQNIGVAAAVASHAYILMNGSIVHHAPMGELADSPQLLDSYLGA
jgi:branched-chain amino acid transport system ATP-binding protein